MPYANMFSEGLKFRDSHIRSLQGEQYGFPHQAKAGALRLLHERPDRTHTDVVIRRLRYAATSIHIYQIFVIQLAPPSSTELLAWSLL
jgi:hypothetical protein